MNNKARLDMGKVAIVGPLRTENLGVEKIVANIISNPNIRYLIIWGEEIVGHHAGQSLISLWKNGIDKDGRITGAKGAVPYIENLDEEAISRFRQQIEVVDMLGTVDINSLNEKVAELASKEILSFGTPYIALNLVKKKKITANVIERYALHKDFKITSYLEIY